MQLPLPLPDVVPGLQQRPVGARRGAGVGAEEIDAAVLGDHGLDQRHDLRLVRDVAGEAAAADGLGGVLHGLFVEIREHDGLRALGEERLRHGLPDAAAAAGDDGDLPLQFHSALPPAFSPPRSVTANGACGHACGAARVSVAEHRRFDDGRPGLGVEEG